MAFKKQRISEDETGAASGFSQQKIPESISEEKRPPESLAEKPEAPQEGEQADKKKPITEDWTIRHIEEAQGNYTDTLNSEILKYLQDLKLITEKDAKLAQKAHREEGENIATILMEKNILREKEVGRAIADYFRCSYTELKGKNIDMETLLILPKSVAQSTGVIAFEEDEDLVHLAMINPADQHFLHLVEKKTGKKAKVYYTTPSQIHGALKFYERSLQEGMQHLIARAQENIEHLENLDNIANIFDTLTLMAFNRTASDIHIEPFEDKIQIRFRIDGVLRNITAIPTRFLPVIINHVKVLAKLRTDEHQSAQDGRFHIMYDQTRINFRVSIIPTHYGEKTVLRLLPVDTQQLTLSDLGYSESDQELVGKSIHKSSGIILVTGPTGSGKTTTLYSILKQLNSEGVNISTVEDPIEYGLPGINQIQVNPKTNITFVEGLRSLLRQDPDIMMIGEIRDVETSKISMHASLTGHLVVSTLHTNSAALAPHRLMQMGLDPYMITSTVALIIAQRLVRKICPHCMTSAKVSRKTIEEYQKKFLLSEEDNALFEQYFGAKKGGGDIRLFKGNGCDKCGNTGYQGRTVIAEVLKMNQNIRDLIMSSASEDKIEKTAKENGMTAMLEDGLQKVLQGKTTLEELFRVFNQ